MHANIKKCFFTVVFLTFLFPPSYSYEPYSEGGLKSPEWQPREMNSRMGGRIEAELKPGSWLCGFFTECKFDLHYFFNEFYDGPAPGRTSESKKPWILFIPGGPGEIVDRDNDFLHFLRNKANIVYFDVRGTGFSLIPESNDYDQFLRADYVVEDIETLRKTLTNGCSRWDLSKLDCKGGTKRWDAIYAHSWGTIVAQKYAAQYPTMVNKLILSAPVSRGHVDTEHARRTMIKDNLFDIFSKHSTTICPWDPEADFPGLVRKEDLIATLPIDENRPAPTIENFCFLRDPKSGKIDDSAQAKLIEEQLKNLLNEIEADYGSVNLVISFYDKFKIDSNFLKKYPYNKAFFDAIRELEDYGAGEQQDMLINGAARSRKVGYALFLAYYLSLPAEVLTNRNASLYPGDPADNTAFTCKPDAPFFNRLPDWNENRLSRNYCNRIDGAFKEITWRTRPGDQSARARNVFSVYDGLSRWIFELMKNERRTDQEGCFTGKDIQDIARGDTQLQAVVLNSAVIKEQAWRLGTKAGDRICPWDPARVDEFGKCKDCLRGTEKRVNTLILKGGADAITAGEQAEYLFEKALEPGHRVLIEFPGVGHFMNHQLRKDLINPEELLRVGNPRDLSLGKAISDFKKMVEDGQTKNSAVYQTLIRGVGQLTDAAKNSKIDQTVIDNRRDLILAFVSSNEISDFVKDKKAREAISNLGGCLRTEDTTEFSDCICKLTQNKHPICKVDKTVVR